MRQRALIAIALACQPRLLIADEPTTALDVTIQAQILELLNELVRETGTALVMITHDLGVVAGLCDTVNVLYGGRVVERAQRHRLFAHPAPPVHARVCSARSRGWTPRRGAAGRRSPARCATSCPGRTACAFAPRCARVIERVRRTCTPGGGDTLGGRLLRCVNPVPAGTRR